MDNLTRLKELKESVLEILSTEFEELNSVATELKSIAFSRILSRVADKFEASMVDCNEASIVDSKNSHFIQNYDLLEYLGKGGEGCVFKVQHKLDKGLFALKIISWRENVRKSKEVQLLHKIEHRNVVRYYHAWTEMKTHQLRDVIDGFKADTILWSNFVLFIVMEFCPSTLDFKINSGGTLQMNEVREIFTQIVEGVREIHRCGIAHGDLKLENIFLDKSGNIKIGDFGFAESSSTYSTPRFSTQSSPDAQSSSNAFSFPSTNSPRSCSPQNKVLLFQQRGGSEAGSGSDCNSPAGAYSLRSLSTNDDLSGSDCNSPAGAYSLRSLSTNDDLSDAMARDIRQLGIILFRLVYNLSANQSYILTKLDENIFPNEWSGEKYSTMKDFIHGMVTATVDGPSVDSILRNVPEKVVLNGHLSGVHE